MSRASTPVANADRAEQQRRRRCRRRRASASSRQYAATAREPDQPPQHLLDPELVHGHRRGRRAAAGAGPTPSPPSTRSTASAAEPSSGPNTPAAAATGDDGGSASGGRSSLGQVADVGQHPQRRAAVGGAPRSRADDQHQAEPGDRAEQRTPRRAGSRQDPPLGGQPADAHHQPVGDQAGSPPRQRARRARRARRSAGSPSAGSYIISSTSHGAATASRAPLTVHACRASSSERVRASSRR